VTKLLKGSALALAPSRSREFLSIIFYELIKDFHGSSAIPFRKEVIATAIPLALGDNPCQTSQGWL
jgi:hypothetical protein